MKELFWHLEFEIPDMFLRSLKSEKLHFFSHTSLDQKPIHPSIHPSLHFTNFRQVGDFLKIAAAPYEPTRSVFTLVVRRTQGFTGTRWTHGAKFWRSPKRKKTREIWKNRLKQNQQGKYLFKIWVWFYLELFSHVQHFVLIYFDI